MNSGEENEEAVYTQYVLQLIDLRMMDNGYIVIVVVDMVGAAFCIALTTRRRSGRLVASMCH